MVPRSIVSLIPAWIATAACAVLGLGIFVPGACALPWQEQAAGQPGVARPLGTIKAISGNNITLTTDAKADVNLAVQDGAKIVRIEPGQKDLKTATPVRLEDLQVGDRILARGTSSGAGQPVAVSLIVLMKKSDISQMQEQQRQEWQRGVGGLVKSVDPAGQSITMTTGAGPTAKTITIHVSNETVLRRYAPGSVNFEDAKPAPLDQIRPGDQLRARGQRSADGTEFTAQEIVSGSFRNIAGRVTAVDPSANQLTVMDLLTKKPVVITLTANSEVRKLPAPMAQMIAMRLKGGAAGAAPGAQAAGGAGSNHAAASGAQSWQGGGAEGHSQYGAGGAAGWRGNGSSPPDFQQMLSRLPAAKIADLNKGDAVMIVSTEGMTGDGVTAITLLAGVEPILTAPASSQAMLLSPWSLGGPSGGEEGAGQ
jgi:hypothetical protein